jgi:hypothetical protein
MSTATKAAPITSRVEQRPTLEPRKARDLRARELADRFLAGAATSIVAGLTTLACGLRIGGILLAFPAILAASLTLIEKQENSAERARTPEEQFWAQSR